MRRPGPSLFGLLMDEDASARWSKGVFVEVKRAVELGFCRESGIDSGLAQEVERGCGLRYEPTPQMHGEVRVEAAEACYEVVFPRTNGFFGCIAAVVVRRHELKLDVMCAHELFELSGGFVVESL